MAETAEQRRERIALLVLDHVLKTSAFPHPGYLQQGVDQRADMAVRMADAVIARLNVTVKSC